jgi:hypothetical protein
VPAKPPAPRPFPFAFTLKGFISGTMYMQDAAFLSGNGNGAIFGPNKTDKWFLGGDVRQTQLKFMVKGPEVLGGIPTESWRSICSAVTRSPQCLGKRRSWS